MTNESVIIVEGLTKIYKLRETRTLEDGSKTNELKALDNVSFEIKKGESVGVIGANGSGKSTLLRILAGVTKPTSGKVSIYGKVASILDIGAGFHPELSGRENVFLNGQIHGFSKKEIHKHYDEIIAFSGIGEFINEPVKNYSNGMYLRLAYSIMVHLEFDIYLFDEVFSVGDVEFGLKTKDKFEDLTKSNKTILYVSHNINELLDLNQYINLEHGEIGLKDKSSSILMEYIEKTVIDDGIDLVTKNMEITDFSKYQMTNDIIIKKIQFYQELGSQEEFVVSKPFILDISYEKTTNKGIIEPVLNLADSLGSSILISSTILNGSSSLDTKKGNYTIRCTISENLLSNKIYCINLSFIQNATTLVNQLRFNELNMEDIERLEEEMDMKVILSLNKLIYFKPKMFIIDNLNVEKLNLTNSLLTPIFKWETIINH